MTIRPRFPSRRIFDADRLRRQIRLYELDADHLGIGPDVENLRGECVGDYHNGDIRLLTQIETQPQGTVRGEVTNERVGQRQDGYGAEIQTQASRWACRNNP